MILRGRAHKLGDNVSTDIHASNKYKRLGITVEEVVQEMFSELDPELSGRVRPGDILVAGRNFGMVSSREDAAIVLKTAGFSVVLARSFGNMFYRNAINKGLPVLECDTDGIETGDEIEVDVRRGTVMNVTKGTAMQSRGIPDPILRLVADGGLIEHLIRNGDFAVE